MRAHRARLSTARAHVRAVSTSLCSLEIRERSRYGCGTDVRRLARLATNGGADQRTASYTFHPSPAVPIDAPANFVITNVVPGDYNYDGRLDVLLMGQASPGSWTSSELKMVVYFGQGEGAFCACFLPRLDRLFEKERTAEAHAVPSSGLAQPMVLDANGDMRVDLLGVTTDSSAKPRLWQNAWSTAPNATGEIFTTCVPVVAVGRLALMG